MRESVCVLKRMKERGEGGTERERETETQTEERQRERERMEDAVTILFYGQCFLFVWKQTFFSFFEFLDFFTSKKRLKRESKWPL